MKMPKNSSEAAKLLLIVFFAGYFVAKRDALALASRRVLGLDLPRARDLGPVLLAWGASLAVLVRGRDLGTSLLFFGIFIVMLYIATERTSWLLIGLSLFGGGASASTCRGPATSGRCCSPGPARSPCSSGAGTSARRCCSSGSSS